MSATEHPPEIAYSWPAVIFALTFVAIFFSRPLAFACLVGAFVACPIRDALLDHYWPPNDKGWNERRPPGEGVSR